MPLERVSWWMSKKIIERRGAWRTPRLNEALPNWERYVHVRRHQNYVQPRLSSLPDNDHSHQERQSTAAKRRVTSMVLMMSRAHKVTAKQTAMCTQQLSAMLGCWAASGDLHNVGECSQTAQDLFQCMRTTVCTLLAL